MRQLSDEGDTVVLAETCFTDSEGKTSDRDSVSVNEIDIPPEVDGVPQILHSEGSPPIEM